jgi:hypothetical protein
MMPGNTSDIKGTIAAMKLFNEKADKLVRLSFIRTMMEQGTQVGMSWHLREDGKYEETHTYQGPDEEAIDAFTLTFRFFIQNNEQSSFYNMAGYYSNAPIDESLKNKYAQVRTWLNNFLDEPSYMNITYNDELLTRRKIMDTIVYGGLAHADNVEKRGLYNEWMNIPPMRLMIVSDFTVILANILDAILFVAELNRKVLEQLQPQDE